MPPRISVVVPTCGRPALLERCVAPLEAQSVPRETFEIIVIEDLARDGPAAARNRGWRQARAPLVAFTDDDTIPDSEWLRRGLEVFRWEPKTDVVCGRIVMPLNGTPTDYERDAQGLERAEFVTANCFCRKQLLEQIGGFDERFRLAWREDSDLHFRLLEAGARIVREPRAIVVHPVRPAPWGVSIGQQRKSMFDALLFKKHPRLYRERIRATPRWDYYAIAASLAAGLFVPQFLLLWAAMTGIFCAKRLRGTRYSPSHIAEMVVTSAVIPLLALFWRLAGALRFRTAFF
jgi:glycosyltransferase involved in cell wall biosynthesis